MNKVDNSTYDNSAHKIGASKVKFILWYFVNALFFINPLNPLSGLKVRLLRLFGAKVGKGVMIKPGVNIKYPWKLTIDDHAWIGERVWIDNIEPVSIGKSACLSQGALLLTGSHDHTKSTFDYICGPIVLEEGVWIGARAMVGGGVTCHSHSILSVNSVAEKDLKPYIVYKGNPAMVVIKRVIKDTSEKEIKA